MAVWDPACQQAWTDDVTAEAVADGWDGVFADNDFAHLSFYSSARLAGTRDDEQADLRIRAGLDQLVTRAGTTLEENLAYWPGQVVDVA